MSNLDSFVAPQSVAIVGASSSPNKIGAAPLRYLTELGYEGEIFPVNPRAQTLAGHRCYPTLTAIGKPVDLAIFALPAERVLSALEDAIAAGVKNVVMFSAGFAETGWAGAQLQEAMLRRARAANVRILGPNCLGFINLSKKVFATFSPVLADGQPPSGKIGMVCQSGAFAAYAFAMARERGIGLSAWMTTGNEGDISVADCIAWMAQDTATQVIMAYMEGCTDGAGLRRALSLARAAGKPVVVVKVGRTELGAQTAATHTAALAGEDAVYDALFRQYGAWRAHSIEAFFDIAHVLATGGMPENDAVGLLTVSGGVGVMMADDAAEAGLDVAPLNDDAQAQIKACIPLAVTHNPVDLTGQVTAEPELLDRTARIMLETGGYGSLLIFLSAFGMNPATRVRMRALAADLRRDFPHRLILFSTLADAESQRALESSGSVCFADPGRAIRTLAALTFFRRKWREPAPQDAHALMSVPPLAHRAYNEAEAADQLRAAGLPLPPQRTAATAEDAVRAAHEAGYPVVMKVLSGEIMHKSDLGGVKLGLANDDEVIAAYEDIMRSLQQAGVRDLAQGVLVAPMCPRGVEVIVGARRDPSLGMVVMLGMGGVNVELLKDVVLRLAPVSEREALEMVAELKSAPLLRGYRGAPVCDIPALAQAIVRVSEFAQQHADSLESLEVNPLVVYPEGQGVMGLDTVLVTRPESAPDLHHVKQQVIQTLPLFEMARMRAANTPRRHPEQGFAGDTPDTSMRWVNQFTHTRRLRTPEDKEVVTPNNDTLFTNAWLDLADGPVVIQVPDMGSRYWVLGFLDAWTNPWAYAGRRTTGNAAQTLFVHGPDWDGQAPEGAHVIASPTRDVWIIGRILVDPNADDLAQVHALQDQFRILRPDGTPALSRVDALFSTRRSDTPDADEYLHTLDVMLTRNPSQTPLVDWPPTPEVLQWTLDEVYAELRQAEEQAELSGGWTTALKVSNSYGTDFLTRARVARNWIGTLGVEEAMYLMAEVDAQGHALNGRHRYSLHFPGNALPQVGAFWSITLYGRSDCLLVDNPIGRHSIGDRTPGVVYEPDGGLHILIQPDEPEQSANWLPSPPDDEFYLVLRLYQPADAHLQGRFDYPPIIRELNKDGTHG